MIGRRPFLGTLALGGTTATLIGRHPSVTAAETPPERTRIRLYKYPGICLAPQ